MAPRFKPHHLGLPCLATLLMLAGTCPAQDASARLDILLPNSELMVDRGGRSVLRLAVSDVRQLEDYLPGFEVAEVSSSDGRMVRIFESQCPAFATDAASGATSGANHLLASINRPVLRGDLDCDDDVDEIDLIMLLSNWGHPDPSSSNVDLDKDGLVNTSDLNALFDNWGSNTQPFRIVIRHRDDVADWTDLIASALLAYDNPDESNSASPAPTAHALVKTVGQSQTSDRDPQGPDDDRGSSVPQTDRYGTLIQVTAPPAEAEVAQVAAQPDVSNAVLPQPRPERPAEIRNEPVSDNPVADVVTPEIIMANVLAATDEKLLEEFNARPAAFPAARAMAAAAPLPVLEAPARLEPGPSGTLFTTDYKGKNILSVSMSDLSVLAGFPIEGRPMGLAFDGQQLYVGNETTSRIQVFDLNGQCVNEFTMPVELPNDIAYDPIENLVYVVASKDKIVRVFDPQGNWIRDIPAAGETALENPVAVAIIRPSLPGDIDDNDWVNVQDLVLMLAGWGPCDPGSCPSDVNGDGAVNVNDLILLLVNWGPNPEPMNIFVSDYGDGFFVDPAIYMYDDQGLFLRLVEGDYSRPQSVYAEDDQQMFVVDAFLGQVLLVDQTTGNTISTLGVYGTDPGQMILPLGLVIDRTTGDLFVASNRTGRIEVFRQGGQLP